MPADRMKESLSTEEFRAKVKTFIATNIQADLPDVHGTDVLSIPTEPRVAFSRPVDPRTPQCYAQGKRTVRLGAFKCEGGSSGASLATAVLGEG